jgi:hypothetical protein
MVDFASAGVYEPRWPGVKELNLADQWRARWVNEQELPDHAPVHYVYALLVMGEKGYALRETGANRWGMLEGLVGELSAEQFLKKAAKDRAGITLDEWALVGFLECKPTRHNTEFSADETTVRPFYVAVAKDVKDAPADSGFERRRFPLNEYVVAMRARYPELLDYLPAAFNRYAAMR